MLGKYIWEGTIKRERQINYTSVKKKKKMVRRVHAITGKKFKNPKVGTSLAVQYLRLHASSAGGTGSISGWGTKVIHAMWCSQKKY